LERGYAPGTVDHELGFLSALGWWMIGEGLEVEQLDGEVVDAFVEVRRAEGLRSASISRRPRSLLIYLRELGVIAPECSEPATPLEELIGSYREWLLVEQGLAAITVVRYEESRPTPARRALSSSDSGARVPTGTAYAIAEKQEPRDRRPRLNDDFSERRTRPKLANRPRSAPAGA
jgi:hypothetical protein